MSHRVSIIIPSYNAGGYLKRAVESALIQDYHNIELVIVDDGSTDGSIDTLSNIDDSRVIILTQENGGKASAMNHALEHIDSKFYCVLDADDTMNQNRISIQLSEILEDESLAAVFCGHSLLMGSKTLAPRMRSKSKEDCSIDIANFRMPAHDPTALYNLNLVKTFKYDDNFPGVEGLDYILRVGEVFPMKVTSGCLYQYRIHSNSITRNNVEKRLELVNEVLRKAYQRRNEDQPTPKAPTKQLSNDIIENGLSTHFLESVSDLRSNKLYKEALTTALFCLRMHPLDFDNWKPLAAATLPQKMLTLLGR